MDQTRVTRNQTHGAVYPLLHGGSQELKESHIPFNNSLVNNSSLLRTTDSTITRIYHYVDSDHYALIRTCIRVYLFLPK